MLQLGGYGPSTATRDSIWIRIQPKTTAGIFRIHPYNNQPSLYLWFIHGYNPSACHWFRLKLLPRIVVLPSRGWISFLLYVTETPVRSGQIPKIRLPATVLYRKSSVRLQVVGTLMSLHNHHWSNSKCSSRIQVCRNLHTFLFLAQRIGDT